MENRTVSREASVHRGFVALACFLALAHAAFLMLVHSDAEDQRVGSTIFLLAAGVFAGAICTRSAIHSTMRIRRSWTMFAAGAWSWVLTQLIWLGNSQSTGLTLNCPYFPMAPTAMFILFALAGCLSLISLPLGTAARARALLDAIIVGVVIGFMAWITILQRDLEQLTGDFVARMSVAAIPIGNILLLTLVATMILGARPRGRLSLTTFAFLATGLIAFSLGDLPLVQGDKGLFRPGAFSDIGYSIGMMWVALGSAWPRTIVRRRARQTNSFGIGQILPSIAAALVLMIVLGRGNRTGEIDLISEWLATCLVVCVLVRQVVTWIEEQRFASMLEARVADRTAALSRRERQFRALVQQSSDVILILEEDGTFEYVSPSIKHVLGHSAEQLAKGTIADIVIEQDRPRVMALLAMSTRRADSSLTAEWRVERADGALRQVEVLVRNLLAEPAVKGIVLNIRDITERKELEEQLTHQALHDELTGLANRALLRLRIEQALARWLFQAEPFSLLVVDIDDFKSINDSLGHVTGDRVLRTVSNRIEECTREGDTVVRLAGDEFAILLEGVTAHDNEAHEVAQRIIDSVTEDMVVDGHRLSLRASMGLACVSEQVGQAEDIMRNADLALHSAKGSTRGGYVRFETAMHESVLRRVELEADLRGALERDELTLYFQPTVDIKTGMIEGAEALLRWPHPTKGLIPPSDFIPLAEESGLIIPIGTWVLQQACAELVKWQLRYPNGRQLRINVNLSTRQMDQPDIVDVVRRAINDSGIAEGTLVLEMTESVLMENKPTTLAKMRELVGLGCELAIDDFGTGYSSLSYLRQFPIHLLKIDRSFVNGVANPDAGEDKALVQAIIDLAHTLALSTVAEGIETDDQLVELQRMGCEVGQGFLLARPAPPDDVRRLIEGTFAKGMPLATALPDSGAIHE